MRIDHVLTEKQRLSFRYGYLLRDQASTDLIKGNVAFPVGGVNDLGAFVRRFQNFGFDDTVTFSPTFLASLRYGSSRRLETFPIGANGFNPADLKLPSILINNQLAKGYPWFNADGGLPALGTFADKEADDSHYLVANFTKLQGDHNLRFGGDYRLDRYNRNRPGGAVSGFFDFNAGFAREEPFVPASANISGSSMASILLALPPGGSLGGPAPVSLQNHMFSLFVQDDWKVSQRLTLNLGLRYDLETPFTERFNRISVGFDPEAQSPVQIPGLNVRGALLLAGVDGNPRRTKLAPNNFSPRVGFAFGFNFLNPRMLTPYNQQWQLSVARALPWQMMIEAAYVGSRSLKQFENFNLSEKPDRFLALGAQEFDQVPNPFRGVLPANSSLAQGATTLRRNLWVQFPQYTNVTPVGANTGRADYNALQLKLEKRLSRGLNFLFSYTRSKLLDNETTSIVNVRRYRTVSALDIPNQMRLAFIYDQPWRFSGSFSERLLDWAVGGWSLSGLVDVSSGQPTGAPINANGRMTRLRDPQIGGEGRDRLGDRRDAAGNVLNPYFDINAFQGLPNVYTITPEPPRYDELRNPGFRSTSMSLFKDFAIVERLRMQLRVDVQNLTNTPFFAAPGLDARNRSTFGVITNASNQRNVQGAVRLSF